MNRAGIEELFTFTDYSWRQYAEAVRPLGDETLVRPGARLRLACIARCIRSHHLGVRPLAGEPGRHLDHWAYVRWLANPGGTSTIEPERIDSWKELEDYRRRVRGHDREYFDSLSDDVLMTPREMNIDGEPMLYSPADIFVHALLHEREHHGDLNTLLYQLGIEPPIVEYRFSLHASRANN